MWLVELFSIETESPTQPLLLKVTTCAEITYYGCGDFELLTYL